MNILKSEIKLFKASTVLLQLLAVLPKKLPLQILLYNEALVKLDRKVKTDVDSDVILRC